MPAWFTPILAGETNKAAMCRTNCEAYGLKAGERHCHGAELDQPKEVVSEHVWVDKVVDGDTVAVRTGVKQMTIRILGIDCPESKRNIKCQADKTGCACQIPWGMKAAKRAAELLKHQRVTLECVGKCTAGVHGRPLRYIRVQDGSDFGLVMIEQGYCADYGWKYPHPRGAEY